MAIPLFLLALLAELAIDRARKTGFFRLNDTINSLSTGVLSTTTGYFSRLVGITIWAFFLQHLALFEIPLENFDASLYGICNWFLALVAFDFCYYWAHRCGHEISIFWAAHAVHHQSEDYNLSTALRQTSSGFLFGWIFYLPLFVLGMPLEVFVTVNALDLIKQNWVHTQHIKRLGWMEKFFVTPSNHRVHHAQNEIYIDRNYGGILIIWDRLFGTFQAESQDHPVRFGVRKPLQSWNPIWANFQVYSYLWFDSVRTRRWVDKVGVWFRRTGWRPNDVEERYPRKKTDPGNFRKFDPEISKQTSRYIAWQYLFVVSAVFWIGGLFATSGAIAVIAPCIWLWTLLFSIGLLSEGSSFALRIEVFRLIILTPSILLVLLPSSENLLVTTAIYVGASLLLLWFCGAPRKTP